MEVALVWGGGGRDMCRGGRVCRCVGICVEGIGCVGICGEVEKGQVCRLYYITLSTYEGRRVDSEDH